MANRILPIFAFLVLVAFLAVLLVRVPRLDLGGVILVTLICAGLDVYRSVVKDDISHH